MNAERKQYQPPSALDLSGFVASGQGPLWTCSQGDFVGADLCDFGSDVNLRFCGTGSNFGRIVCSVGPLVAGK